MKLGFILFPRLTLLDLVGPMEVFGRVRDVEMRLIWKTLDPVASDLGVAMLPDLRLADCAALDILCIPGGPGQIDLMEDREVLDFVARIAPGCRHVCSVCTGSLVLAAAGLLEGRRAACHWASADQLSLFGAEPSAERVTRDGPIATGAGVTSGIDFALSLVAEIWGAPLAREIVLQMEYDPAPPVRGGTPATADSDVAARVRGAIAPILERRRAASIRAAAARSAH